MENKVQEKVAEDFVVTTLNVKGKDGEKPVSHIHVNMICNLVDWMVGPEKTPWELELGLVQIPRQMVPRRHLEERDVRNPLQRRHWQNRHLGNSGRRYPMRKQEQVAVSLRDSIKST